MTEKTEIEINEKLAREEFRLRSIAEAVEQSKAIAEEIKAVLRKHGASLAEWNSNLYIVPKGFKVYSIWNFPRGVIYRYRDYMPPIQLRLPSHQAVPQGTYT